MQFDKKPFTPDSIPVKLTVPETEWLTYEATFDTGDEARNEAHLALLRKVMQARRDAVGDQLPPRLAKLPLISRDMPRDDYTNGVMEWSFAMGDLRKIDLYPLNPDHEAPHTVAVNLTINELGMIVGMAAFALESSSERDPFDMSYVAEMRELFGEESGSPAAVRENQEIELGNAIERGDIARAMLHAMLQYGSEQLPG